MTLSDFLKDKTVKDVAQEIGISAAYLSQLKHGVRIPSLPVALRIYEVTHGQVTVADLLGEKSA